ncbi:MAG TPA: serine protease [Thiothrix sp.]|nr:serine protease [Thiothrix sp.]
MTSFPKKVLPFGVSLPLLSTLFLTSASFAGVANYPAQQQWQGAAVYSMFDTMGSGVPVSQCHVLTNEHVVRGSKRANVDIAGERYTATVISIDSDNDMALLRVSDCPIEYFAKLSKVAPKKGDMLTSVYYKPGFNFFRRMTKTKGKFVGFGQMLTEEDKTMTSMIIDDKRPRIGSSGGGISTKNGLVSIIYGVASKYAKPTTYAISYDALKAFMLKNHI